MMSGKYMGSGVCPVCGETVTITPIGKLRFHTLQYNGQCYPTCGGSGRRINPVTVAELVDRITELEEDAKVLHEEKVYYRDSAKTIRNQTIEGCCQVVIDTMRNGSLKADEIVEAIRGMK